MRARGRGYWREREREFREQVAEQEAKRAALREREEFGAFIMDADAYRLALIEQFGVTALRRQLASNVAAYREEGEGKAREHIRATLADALKLARRSRSPSFRIVLYTEERDRWCEGNPLGGPCEPREYGRSPDVRRRQAERDLAKLSVPVEHVNPNEPAGDG